MAKVKHSMIEAIHRPSSRACERIVVVLLLLGISLLLACNSDAEKHRLIISGAVHVYPTDVPPAAYPGSNFIEVLGPKDHVKVRDVEYKNGYMAVKVRLGDGREGWVFSGESIDLK